MTRWWPDTVLGQMICIVFAVVFMVFALGEALEDRFDRLTSDGLDDDEYLRQVAVLAVVMRHQSAADLERDLQSLSEIGIQGRVLPAQPEALHTGRTESLNWTKVILCCPDLPAPEGVARVDGERMVLFPLATGGQLAFPQRPSGGSTGGEFLYFPLATGILVLGFSIFAIWGVSRPIGGWQHPSRIPMPSCPTRILSKSADRAKCVTLRGRSTRCEIGFKDCSTRGTACSGGSATTYARRLPA
ncbi:hypothetical protein AKL17_1648 [Frigidibacter mobilis]|uniref:Uncharacterized protein n=1 Tax=Frigidibacter mobilis TaxID=1335048 RepID=A0A159Z3V3_9RHOB|nr:hypothetical protein [Frigidibacter mobilis]AMY68900.1 hypothetical protein AKL17_1648 [Frigidibacter mobilis]